MKVFKCFEELSTALGSKTFDDACVPENSPSPEENQIERNSMEYDLASSTTDSVVPNGCDDLVVDYLAVDDQFGINDTIQGSDNSFITPKRQAQIREAKSRERKLFDINNILGDVEAKQSQDKHIVDFTNFVFSMQRKKDLYVLDINLVTNQ